MSFVLTKHTNTAPRPDGIPAEVIGWSAERILLQLHHILSLLLERVGYPVFQISKSARLPHCINVKDAGVNVKYIIVISKVRIYRSTSLFSVVGTAFASMALGRVRKLAERIYLGSQTGFRSGLSTINMIFSLRHLKENCREQKHLLHNAFVDFTKSFDTVRRGYSKVKIGPPAWLLRIIQSFYLYMKTTKQFKGNTSEPLWYSMWEKTGMRAGSYPVQHLIRYYVDAWIGTHHESICHQTMSDSEVFSLIWL